MRSTALEYLGTLQKLPLDTIGWDSYQEHGAKSHKETSQGVISDMCHSMVGHISVVLLETDQASGGVRSSCVTSILPVPPF